VKRKQSDYVLLSPCQIVAWNLEQVRRERGWSQDEAIRRLEPYLGYGMTRAAWSKAERSYDGNQVRHFDAEELVAFARVFEVPISYFLTPPEPILHGKGIRISNKPAKAKAHVTAAPLERDEMMRLAAHALVPSGTIDEAGFRTLMAQQMAKAMERAARAYLEDHPEDLRQIAAGLTPAEFQDYLRRDAETHATEEEAFAQKTVGLLKSSKLKGRK
jgi:hypothetical protein